MADLLITKVRGGVAIVTRTDPFSKLEIHRITREAWGETPETPGIYILYGFVEGEPAAYVGMSTTNMRQRIRTHHVTPVTDWFGVLFAIPTGSPLLLPAIEAELIRRVTEAGVVGTVGNVATEERWLDAEDVHVTPAVEAIVGAMEMLLGSDIFTSDEEPAKVEKIQPPTPKLARVYKGAAEHIAPRRPDDIPAATHRFAGETVRAWGRFEAPEPDTRFRVMQSSGWRPARVNPDYAVLQQQEKLLARQLALVDDGVLDKDADTFLVDHVFDSWSQAAKMVSGWSSFSGGYHWQRVEPTEGGGAMP